MKDKIIFSNIFVCEIKIIEAVWINFLNHALGIFNDKTSSEDNSFALK